MQLQPLAYPQIKFVSTFLASNRIHFGFMNVHVFKVSASVHTEEHFSKIFLFLCGRFLFPNRQLFSYIQSNPFSLNNHPSCHCVLCLSLWSGCCQQVYAKSALPQGSIIRLLPFFFRCYFKLVVLLFFSLYSVLNAFFVKLTPLFPFSTSSIIIESFSCSIS